MNKLDKVHPRSSTTLKLIPTIAVTLLLPLLSQSVSAAGMPQKLLVPEAPSNYKVTITRSYDPAVNWQITVFEDGNLYASGKETDIVDEKKFCREPSG